MSRLITDRQELEKRVMDVADVVAWEQEIAASGTPLAELMRHAGAAVAEVAVEMLSEHETPIGEQRIVILCGSGNNGGDGWVAAELLAAQGYPVMLASRDVAKDLKAEPARTNALLACEAGGFDIMIDPNTQDLAALLDSSTLMIDAILGTGFTHDTVREPYNNWIALANQAREANSTKILAVDCPSGLIAQTGSTATTCIKADATITMLAVKPGLLHLEASQNTGVLRLATLTEHSG
ncbi:NAD(P)H-hydrate epimerase [Anaerotardibacter muris]|uniref:NAD(P)H-hydrate epimerase n=1 Tax=Anaerotardibacter muris TaxID=2941505 RepID=UPI00203E60D1|nr:NAD(P)H-hydrate epimerase [Anaerotardibacter muris]